MTTTSCSDLGAGVLRLRAANASPMTGTGTNSYLLQGPEGAVLIDPGPALPAHRDAILHGLLGRPLRAILVTHAHLDHSQLVPEISAITGAPVYAFGRAQEGRSLLMQSLFAKGLIDGGEGVDLSFTPDHRLIDGQILHIAGLTIEALHTPGHMAGHMCFALKDQLFSGDHVMGWSSSIISPPDGDMAAYMKALARLSDRSWKRFLPGHGDLIDTPAARCADLTRHRQQREAAILAELRKGPATPADLAKAIYTETPKPLLPAATRNILAHLIDLHSKNVIEPLNPISADAFFRIL